MRSLFQTQAFSNGANVPTWPFYVIQQCFFFACLHEFLSDDLDKLKQEVLW